MHPAAQCRHLLKTYGSLLDGLDDSHRANQPMPDGKTAGWLVGHLAVTGDFGRRLCGAKAICPADWRARFNPGTKPSTNAADYPPMSEMVARFREVYTDLPVSFENAGDKLAVENPFEPGRRSFPTAGDFAAYLMTGHLGYHLGQLYGWRAAAGNQVQRL
jgi:hypothetical protein